MIAILGITEATLPWVLLFTVIVVGSGYGFGLFLRDLVRAARGLFQRRTLEEQLRPWVERTGKN